MHACGRVPHCRCVRSALSAEAKVRGKAAASVPPRPVRLRLHPRARPRRPSQRSRLLTPSKGHARALSSVKARMVSATTVTARSPAPARTRTHPHTHADTRTQRHAPQTESSASASLEVRRRPPTQHRTNTDAPMRVPGMCSDTPAHASSAPQQLTAERGAHCYRLRGRTELWISS